MAIDVQEITGTTAIAAARLSDFSTGGAVPLPAHTAWLDSKVKPLISGNPSAWVDLLGHASRQWKHTGGMNSHQLNRILSFQRCEALKARIAGYGSSVRFNVEFAEGDDQSVMPNPNDGYDRAADAVHDDAQRGPADVQFDGVSIPGRGSHVRLVQRRRHNAADDQGNRRFLWFDRHAPEHHTDVRRLGSADARSGFRKRRRAGPRERHSAAHQLLTPGDAMAAKRESRDQIPALLRSKIGDAAVAMRLSARGV